MHNPIVIDYETDLISKDAPVPRPVCLSWYDGIQSGLLLEEDCPEFLQKNLTEGRLVIAHNVKFEALVTLVAGYMSLEKVLKVNWYCTKIAQKIQNAQQKSPIQNVSLANLLLKYFNEDVSATKGEDAWRMRYSELRGIPLSNWPQEAVDYCIDDAKNPFRCYKFQISKLKINQTQVLEATKADICLSIMANTGIHISLNRVEQLKTEMLNVIDPLKEELKERGFICLKKGSKNMKLIRKYIIENFQTLYKTKTKQIATGKEELKKYLGEKDDAVLRNLLKINEYEKILTAFIKNLEEANPLIRTEYTAIGATSGRTSSNKSKFYPSVNMQQMPRSVKDVTYDIRNCFKAREGFLLCSIDYSGLELAATAHQLGSYYGSSKLRDTLNAGDRPTDLHSNFAKEIMYLKEGRVVSYDEFVTNKKEGKYAEYRQLAKPLNLGFPGGIGYDTMRGLLAKEGIYPKYILLEVFPIKEEALWYYTRMKWEYPDLRVHRVGKSEYALVRDELVTLKDTLLSLYPELKQFLTTSHERFQTGESKPQLNDFGEWEQEPMHRYDIKIGKDVAFTRNYCTYTALCNGYLMQSPSAVGAKRAVINVVSEFAKCDKLFPLAFIHDEILLEVKDDSNIYQNVDRVAEIMIDSMHEVLPSVRIAVEADLMQYWSKSGGDWSKEYHKDSPLLTGVHT